MSGVRLAAGASREEYRRRLANLREEKRNEAVQPPEERCSREEMRMPGRQPRILLTNVKQLELLLTRQKDVELFDGARLEILVVDEAHTFAGANGAETACLLRRLRTFCGKGERETVCVATSATLSDRDGSSAPARTFAVRFFGVAEEDVSTVTEEYEETPFAAERRVPPPLADPAASLSAVLAALDTGDPAAEAAQACGRAVTEEEVLFWLVLGAAARREGRPLVRPVVHDFVRGIDGAVVSFPAGEARVSGSRRARKRRRRGSSRSSGSPSSPARRAASTISSTP